MKTTMRSLAIIIAIAGLFTISRMSVQAHPSIDIVASNWKFTPDTIELHVGEATALRLTSSEGVHGLESSDLGIATTTIMPGSFTTINVTPKKAGTIVLHCSIMCGAGHENMTLTVKVMP